MVNFNEYINEIDFSEFKKHFLEKGKSIEIKKKDYFVRQNEPCKYVGFVESGIFRYTRIDMLVTNLLSVIVLPKILCVITHH